MSRKDAAQEYAWDWSNSISKLSFRLREANGQSACAILSVHSGNPDFICSDVHAEVPSLMAQRPTSFCRCSG